jgi:anti-sigma regulatory factor (Ser/Thr protein kinase)
VRARRVAVRRMAGGKATRVPGLDTGITGKLTRVMLSERLSSPRPQPFRVRIRLSADAEAPARAREALRPLAGRATAERLQSLDLVVSELVTNAVRHSPADGPGAIGLEVLCVARTVSVAVTDPGRGFDAEAPRPEPGAGGGFGLYLVEELTNCWWVERVPSGTRVTAELTI